MAERTPIRWRDAAGRVTGGFVKEYDQVAGEYVVGVPNWLTGDVEWVRVRADRAVLGTAPWPQDR